MAIKKFGTCKNVCEAPRRRSSDLGVLYREDGEKRIYYCSVRENDCIQVIAAQERYDLNLRLNRMQEDIQHVQALADFGATRF